MPSVQDPAVLLEVILQETETPEKDLSLITRAFETATNGIVISDASRAGLPIIYASQSFYEFTGYDIEEVIGQNCRFLQGQGTNPQTVATICQALQNQQSFQGEILNYRKNGEPFWNLLRIEPIFSQGKLKYFIGVQTDITAQKQTEEKLRQFEKIFNSASDMTSLVSKDFIYLAVNQAYLDNYERKHADIVGLHIKDLHGEEFFTERRGSLERVFAGECLQVQDRIQLPGRPPCYIDVKITPYEDELGIVQGAVISTRDITALKKAEEALGQYKVIMSLSNDFMSLVDCNYHYLAISDSYLKRFGKPREAIVGKHIASVHGELIFNSYFKASLDRCLAGECVQDQHWVYPQGNACFVDTEKIPYRDENGNIIGAVISAHDITDLKKIEQELSKSEARFKDFAEIAADFLWETDENLNFTYLSEQQEYITKYNAKQWLGQSYLEFLKILVIDEELCKKQQQLALQHKPFNLELPLQRSDGTVLIVRNIAKPVIVQNEFKGYRGIGRDVTEAHTLAKQLEHQANYDSLTGLVNRRAFDSLLEQALSKAKNNQQQHVLCYIDLDQFKVVNDTIGHAAGDELLKQVSALLKSNIRSSDALARLGGDEFALLMKNCPLNKGLTIADKLIADLHDYSFCKQKRRFKIGASIGLVPITSETESTAQILLQADIACYAAKDGGRNRVHVYNNKDNTVSERHAELTRVSDLRNALQENLFCLYYQYVKPLNESNGLEPYYELLLRLKDKDGNLVLPGNFIPAAERYNLMADIDKWVIQTVLVKMQDLFAKLSSGCIAINLSGTSLNDQKLLEFVKQQFQQSHILPKRICFEITETAAISSLNEALNFIEEMREFGCQFALDDFGSGLSSFAYLKRFEVDYLKIDGNLVRDMTIDYTDQAMVKAINDIGHTMKIHTIAEFVETDADIALLKQLKVDYAQGYGVSRPAPLETLAS